MLHSLCIIYKIPSQCTLQPQEACPKVETHFCWSTKKVHHFRRPLFRFHVLLHTLYCHPVYFQHYFGSKITLCELSLVKESVWATKNGRNRTKTDFSKSANQRSVICLGLVWPVPFALVFLWVPAVLSFFLVFLFPIFLFHIMTVRDEKMFLAVSHDSSTDRHQTGL